MSKVLSPAEKQLFYRFVIKYLESQCEEEKILKGYSFKQLCTDVGLDQAQMERFMAVNPQMQVIQYIEGKMKGWDFFRVILPSFQKLNEIAGNKISTQEEDSLFIPCREMDLWGSKSYEKIVSGLLKLLNLRVYLSQSHHQEKFSSFDESSLDDSSPAKIINTLLNLVTQNEIEFSKEINDRFNWYTGVRELAYEEIGVAECYSYLHHTRRKKLEEGYVAVARLIQDRVFYQNAKRVAQERASKANVNYENSLRLMIIKNDYSNFTD